jgi:hypothetical protein
MARRKKTSKLRIVIWVGVLAIAIVAAGFGLRRAQSPSLLPVGTAVSTPDLTDTASPGRKVTVTGKLEISKPPRDSQLGITADAAILFRHVEMYEWLEHCESDACRYDTGWSRQPIDSHKFSIPVGHENPAFPFVDERFAAGEIRVGAFAIDPELIAIQTAAVDYPVRVAALPPNLAATFREVNGTLLTGSEGPPVVGEVRVTYRIVPLGAVSLTGVQHDAKLTVN